MRTGGSVTAATPTASSAAKAGIGFGSALAITISWSVNKSIIWAIIHGAVMVLRHLLCASVLESRSPPLWPLPSPRRARPIPIRTTASGRQAKPAVGLELFLRVDDFAATREEPSGARPELKSRGPSALCCTPRRYRCTAWLPASAGRLVRSAEFNFKCDILSSLLNGDTIGPRAVTAVRRSVVRLSQPGGF